MQRKSKLPGLEQSIAEERTLQGQNEILARKIDVITAGLYKYLHRQLSEEVSKENSITVANYVLAQKTEVNLADTYRANILATLITLSISLSNKPFKDITKDDILLYLDSLRKPEGLDPSHKWIGTYNEKRQRLVKFFRWLYNPHEKPPERKTPDFMKNIPKLKRKEISCYKPTDLWAKDEDLLFLRYCPNKRDKCYHAISRDASARPHEILGLKIRDIVFKTSGDKQYAEVIINGKTGSRAIPLIESIPYLKDWINDHPQQPGNPNALLLPSLAHSTFGTRLSVNALYAIYARYKKQFFPKLLQDPNIPTEHKRRISELLKKPWNPYIRRHSALTEKAKILKEPILKMHAGWSPRSQMNLKYEHWFGNESNESILEAYGIVTKNQQLVDTLKPKQCPQCCEPNKPDSRFCVKCRMVLTYDAYNETLEKQQEKDSEIQTLKEQMKSMQTIVASFGKLMDDQIDSISVEDKSKVYENRLFDQATKKRYESNSGRTYIGNLNQLMPTRKNK